MPETETDRLALRKLSTADAAFMLDLLNQPAFLRFIGDRGVRTIADAEKYIEQGPIDSYARLGFGLYLVERKADSVPIGICGLLKRATLKDVDIGFALLPQYWSQGYACEAAAAVMAYGKDVLGLSRIVAIVTPNNERSIRVLEKIGLRFERTLTSPEDGVDLKLYAAGVDDRALLRRLSQTVAQVVDFYQNVDDPTIMVNTTWTARDVLVHVVFWHESFARNVRDLANGVRPTPLKGTYIELGRRAADEAVDRSIEELLARLIGAQQAVEEFIYDPYVTSIPYKVGSRPYSPAEHLGVVNEHVSHHLREVQSAAARGQRSA